MQTKDAGIFVSDAYCSPSGSGKDIVPKCGIVKLSTLFITFLEISSWQLLDTEDVSSQIKYFQVTWR